MTMTIQADEVKKLRAFVENMLQDKNIPGAAVGFIDENGIHAECFGVTNIDHPLPVTVDTLFQIGSITKTFTASVIMHLVEMGLLELDKPVRAYIPEFEVSDRKVSEAVTIRHLISHMAGWFGDLFLDTGPGDDALKKYIGEMADLEQVAPQNTIWSYNNSGFCAAGYIIETITNQSYQEAVKEIIFDSLGMDQCFFDPAEVMTNRFAVGHATRSGQAKVLKPWALPRAIYPAGGIASSVTDLLNYARFHVCAQENTDSHLLSRKMVTRMQTPTATIWKDEQFGLGWFLKTVQGTRIVYHGGATLGQQSLLTLIPKHHFAIAVFVNGDSGNYLLEEITNWIANDRLGINTKNPMRPVEEKIDSEGVLSEFVGVYENPLSRIELTIQNSNLIGKLAFKRGFPTQDSPPIPSPPPMKYALYEKDRLIVVGGEAQDEIHDIIRTSDGSIGWLRIGHRLNKRLDR